MAGLGQQLAIVLVNNDYGVQAPAAALNTGFLDVSKFLNGTIKGNVHSDVAMAGGVITVSNRADPAVADMDHAVPQDAGFANFQYPFVIALVYPFVQLQFTVGAAPTTYLRVYVTVMPMF